jgi:hypothetical protein
MPQQKQMAAQNMNLRNLRNIKGKFEQINFLTIIEVAGT